MGLYPSFVSLIDITLTINVLYSFWLVVEMFLWCW